MYYNLKCLTQACWTSRVFGTDGSGHTVFCERACEIDLQGLLAIETQWPGSVLQARAQYMEAAFRLRQQSSVASKKVRFRSVLIADLKGLQVKQLLKSQIRDLVTACMNLGNHYPCSLHKQYIVNTPWAFRIAYVSLTRRSFVPPPRAFALRSPPTRVTRHVCVSHSCASLACFLLL